MKGLEAPSRGTIGPPKSGSSSCDDGAFVHPHGGPKGDVLRAGRRVTARLQEGEWSLLLLVLGAVFVLLGGMPAFAQASQSTDLSNASLEELMNVEVTSASKKEQKLSHVAAAVYVIAQDGIRRSGARNIPDLLRMVPGLDVAQIDANSWAISARGFNGLYGNKMLVLVDGRSVYDPAFGGVFWDSLNIPLEDIERIEVIRGPGGTVWGANAVNGVINIITKSAESTQGYTVSLGAGSQGAGEGLAQVGGRIRSKGFYRVFADYFNENSLFTSSGQRGADGWHVSRGGFRSDLALTPKDSLSLEGDFYGSEEGQTIQSLVSLLPFSQGIFNDPIQGGGGSVLGRWEHRISDRSSTSLQMYYDGLHRLEFGLHHDRDTLDVDFEDHYTLNSSNDIVWGFDYRLDAFDDRPGYAIAMVPPGRTDNFFSGFLQDEIRMSNSSWLTLGSKLEHNNYTGFEYEPSALFLYMPSNRQAIWGAIARAIRQPSRDDVDLRYDAAAFYGSGGLLTLVANFGNPELQSEKLIAYETGYRLQAANRLSFDLATFFHDYRDLRSLEPSAPYLEITPQPPHLVVPTIFENGLKGNAYGAEVSSTINIFDWWRVSPGYSWLRMNLYPTAGSLDTTSVLETGDSPRQQFQVRSSMSLPHRVDFDSALYYVSALPDQKVQAYERLDVRVGWDPGENVELSVAGQNLLQPGHFEFGQTRDPVHPTQIPRSVFGEVRWVF